MKKMSLLPMGAVALLLAFTACSEELSEVQLSTLKQIVMTATDFEIEDGSRTNFQITNAGAEFSWAANDTVGIFPDEGAQAYFPMTSGAGTKSANFTGGGWALKDASTYAAYYPFIGDFYLNKNVIPVDYTGQVQTGDASTAHLGAYDYMAAVPATPKNGNVSFAFKHLGALVQLKLTVPQPVTLTSVKLVTETESFVVKGTVDLMSASPIITPKTTSKAVKLNLQNVATTEENQVVTLYMMLSPTDLGTHSLKAVIMTDKGVEEVTLESKNFQAGKAYGLSGQINDKNQNDDEDEVVGDGTFKDGVVSLLEAGTMKQLLGDDFLDITSLKVVGPINGDDVYYLRKMEKLTTLDLSEASIVEGGEWYYEYSSSKRYYTSKNVIGDYMFRGCANLQNVVLPNGVTSIGNSAFSSCSSLTSIDIPDGVTSIGGSAFSGCSSLTTITIGKSVTSIGNSAFSGCSSLTFIDIPNGVTSIGHRAFYECRFLDSVTIGDGVISIGDYAFYYCYSLDSVMIGDGVTSIGDYAFYYCSSLDSINIPESVTSIGNYAFYDCYSLVSITIGNGVTSIGDFAFDGCNSLSAVYITDLSAWCNITFSNGNSSSNPLNYGAKLYLNNNELRELVIPSDIKQIKSFAFCGCKSLTKVTIGDSVSSIGGYAFYGCSSLTSIDISEGVTSIGYNSFGRSSLISIDIPNSVTSISGYAFSSCTSLASIDIPDGVTSIGDNAFYDCTSLASVAIGDGIASIGNYVFGNCTSLNSIDIPDGVTLIGESSFSGCI